MSWSSLDLDPAAESNCGVVGGSSDLCVKLVIFLMQDITKFVRNIQPGFLER